MRIMRQMGKAAPTSALFLRLDYGRDLGDCDGVRAGHAPGDIF